MLPGLAGLGGGGGYGPASTAAGSGLRAAPYDPVSSLAAALPAAGVGAGGGDWASGLAATVAALAQVAAGVGQAPVAAQPPSQVSGETCQFFQKAGWCKFGDTCRFAHVNGGTLKEVCQFYQKAGWCRWGDQCRHLHPGSLATGVGPPLDIVGAEPLPAQGGLDRAARSQGGNLPNVPTVCKFYMMPGGCKLGSSCRFNHSGNPNEPEVCMFFSRSGWCRYGDQCRYVHSFGGNAPEGLEGSAAPLAAAPLGAAPLGAAPLGAAPLGPAAAPLGMPGADGLLPDPAAAGDADVLAQALLRFAKAAQAVASASQVPAAP